MANKLAVGAALAALAITRNAAPAVDGAVRVGVDDVAKIDALQTKVSVEVKPKGGKAKAKANGPAGDKVATLVEFVDAAKGLLGKQAVLDAAYAAAFKARFGEKASRAQLKEFRAELNTALIESGLTKPQANCILSRCMLKAGHRLNGGKKKVDQAVSEFAKEVFAWAKDNLPSEVSLAKVMKAALALAHEDAEEAEEAE